MRLQSCQLLLSRVSLCVQAYSRCARTFAYGVTRARGASGSRAASTLCAFEDFSLAMSAASDRRRDRPASAERVPLLTLLAQQRESGARALLAALPFGASVKGGAAVTLATAAATTSPAVTTFLSVFPPMCFGFLQMSGCVLLGRAVACALHCRVERCACVGLWRWCSQREDRARHRGEEERR
jgi:hypothetical protein